MPWTPIDADRQPWVFRPRQPAEATATLEPRDEQAPARGEQAEREIQQYLHTLWLTLGLAD